MRRAEGIGEKKDLSLKTEEENVALGTGGAVEGSMWTVFWIPNCSFSCLCFTNLLSKKKSTETCDIIGIHYSKWMCCRGWFRWVSEQHRYRHEKSMSHLVLIKSFHSYHSHGLCIRVQECFCPATSFLPCGQPAACGMANTTPQLTLMNRGHYPKWRSAFSVPLSCILHGAFESLCIQNIPGWDDKQVSHLTSVMPHSQYAD